MTRSAPWSKCSADVDDHIDSRCTREIGSEQHELDIGSPIFGALNLVSVLNHAHAYGSRISSQGHHPIRKRYFLCAVWGS